MKVIDPQKDIVDTLELARSKYPGSSNSLDSLCKKFNIDLSKRTKHNALLDCKLLREVDPNHNVYVGPVGMWMPWEPEAYKTGRVEYLEEELNQLMHEKNQNEA